MRKSGQTGRVVVEAPGKVNLSLDIVGATADGYHALETVMHAVSLSDLLLVGTCPGTEIRVTCSQPGIPEDQSNIAHRAARLFLESLELGSQGLSIHISKRIPAQAGLGGGSADGAGVLVALDALFGTGLSSLSLRELGEKIGADVPFCVEGGCALAEGKGERLTPLSPLRDCLLLIAKPEAGVSTVEAYRGYDSHQGPLFRPDRGAMVGAIRDGDLGKVGSNMINVFEQVTALPDTGWLKDAMIGSGGMGAALSGSGSAVVGLFSRKDQAEECAANLAPRAAAWLAQPLATGARILYRD